MTATQTSVASASAGDMSAAGISPSVTTVASTVPLANASALAQSSSDTAPAATVATTEHPAADEGGLPQLKTEYWGGQIVWLLFIFVVFFVLMATVFAPRLRKVIDTRGSTIAEDLANARANRDEAEARIRGLRDEAMGHVAEIASDTAQAMVEKLTGKAATAAALKAAFGKSAAGKVS